MESPVALIFFNRPDTLAKVFESVRSARPKELYLIQDGPREKNKNDLLNIQKCRRIVDNVDWNCKVYKNYSEQNLGCGIRPQTGITWVFSLTDRAIILEDDCVPNQTFFTFCDEMLERYKDDERIAYISGLNHFETWDFGGNSYGFTKGGAIWGWASWARSWKNYDYKVSLIDDPYINECLKNSYPGENNRINLWNNTKKRLSAGENLSYWDAQWGFVKYSQSQYVIVPCNNLICNIGVGVASTHATLDSNNHKRFIDYNNMPTKELVFPLKHPKVVLLDSTYDKKLLECNKNAKRRMLLNALKNKIFKRNG